MKKIILATGAALLTLTGGVYAFNQPEPTQVPSVVQTAPEAPQEQPEALETPTPEPQVVTTPTPQAAPVVVDTCAQDKEANLRDVRLRLSYTQSEAERIRGEVRKLYTDKGLVINEEYVERAALAKFPYLKDLEKNVRDLEAGYNC